jgi:hypothetical protein
MDNSEKQSFSAHDNRDIFERMNAGEPLRLDDPQYTKGLFVSR